MEKKVVVLFFIFITSCLFSTIKAHDVETIQIARELHSELHACNYERAYHSANALRRKVSSKLIFGSCLYAEFARLCIEESLPCGDDELRQFLNMYKYAYIAVPQKYIRQLDELSNYFYNNQDSRSAIIVYNTLLNHREILSPNEQVKYLCKKGWAYNYCREPYKAYQTFVQSVDYSRTQFGIVSEQYAKSLNGMAYECQYLHKESLPYYLQLTDIHKSLYGEKSKELAINYDNIAGRYHKGCGNLDSALVYYNKAFIMFKEVENSSQDIMKCLSNMGTCYSALGNGQKALECYEAALLHGCASTLLHNIAYIYKQRGQIVKAFEYINQMDSVWRCDHFGSFVAECYAKKGDMNNCAYYFNRQLNSMKNVWHNNFVQMTETERQAFLYQGYNCTFDSLFVIAEKYKNNAIARICYDYLLATKSLSLSFDQHIKDLVQESGNVELQTEFDEVTRLKNLAKYEKSIKPLARDSETRFLLHLQEQTDYTELLDITSSDVAKSLSKQDIVIEFYNADEHDSNNLYALVLTSDNITEIFRIDSTDKIDETIIWESLQNVIDPYKNIYFVADGIVNRLPMESAIVNGEFVSNKHNIFRLSSSRQLALRKPYHNQTGSYVLYGGLNYFCLLANSEPTNSNVTSSQAPNTIIPDLRGADMEISDLPGTLTEVQSIAKTIKRSEKTSDIRMIIGDRGTEQSFKQLSGQNVNVLHIATHGFYYGGTSVRVVNFPYFGGRYNSVNEDVVLTKSGLYMSGAEYSLNNDVAESIDGILTSLEVSTLDLRGLNLVTLSACETGLGAISSDGVFGLQRGFKKAGANSILMSLWKVDDAATCKLMTEFYSNWIGKKMTKHGALEAAKKTVRETKGWEDPKYWAAFILLDGLD